MSSTNNPKVDSNVEIIADDLDVATQTKTAEKSLEEKVEFAPQNTPPNGGLQAWLQVLGGFFALFNSAGLVSTFGAFQSYYASDLLKGLSPSTIAWIGSIQGFLVVAGAIVVGRLVDAGFSRILLYIGTFMVTFGMMMASISTRWYQLFLSQGLCTGLGCSMLLLVAMAIVAQYFTTKRSWALGIVTAGSPFAGVIYPIMVRRLIVILGFPWAARILAFVMLATCSLPCLLLRSRLPPRKSGPLIDYPSLVDLPFVLFTFGLLFAFMGVYIPIFFTQSYALQVGIDHNLAFYMTSILNVGQIIGRLVPNYLADRFGPLNVMLVAIVCSCVLLFSWIRIANEAGLIVFSLLYGFFAGTVLSIPAACIASMTKDFSLLGTRLGMSFFVGAFGSLIGSPVAGAIIHRQKGGFSGAKAFGGAVIAFSLSLFLISRLLISGFVWKKKC